ncbi:hypothetical protein [Metabacillus fastidiosus]|uniref:hypothetical protein n=1 Tax=Metabacillus fastidiosus TaxID=1458 RepID=UPI002E1CA283|nr:hypothetical protein [Metabacillus fastidiosus]
MGFGAVFDNKPVGLSLIKLDHLLNRAHLFHFVISHEEYKIDIIQSLLEKTESSLKERSLVLFEVTITISEMVKEVRELFSQYGWGKSPQITRKYIVDIQGIQNNEWVWQLNQPDKLRVVQWSSAEEDSIDQLILNNNCWFPSVFSPNYESDYIDSEYSFALYADGELAGWIICEKVAINMLLCKNVYVKKSSDTRLGGILLMATLIKQIEEKNMFVTFFVEENNISMENIIRRRLEKGIIQEINLLSFIK